MTEPKTELDELKAMQMESQKLRERRVTPEPAVAAASPADIGKTPDPDSGTREGPEAPADQDDPIEGLSGQIENIMFELEDAAAEHPALALLAAFGIGVFVGQLLSRR